MAVSKTDLPVSGETLRRGVRPFIVTYKNKSIGVELLSCPPWSLRARQVPHRLGPAFSSASLPVVRSSSAVQSLSR
ncbi:hypothetical protein [Bradyrhizobium sp. ARR65]|uniref:hypothetical protein n=1 Tax=Bradyrhizobium sp. ARR65 TaxID=1040989 RepID=UPI000A6A79FA|nr:hypothetical protein [Bradyrhizobium sp. ARR65]